MFPFFQGASRQAARVGVTLPSTWLYLVEPFAVSGGEFDPEIKIIGIFAD